MDLRYAHHESPTQLIQNGIKPFWRRIFGDFVGLPAAFFITLLAWVVLDCWLIVEDNEMVNDILIHIGLTLGISTLLTLATAYFLKRRQCQMRLVRIPRLPGGKR